MWRTPKEMMECIDNGEMKMVRASVTLVVPSYMTHENIRNNVDSGVSFIIEEHLFTMQPNSENMSIDELNSFDPETEDDVTLLQIEIDDVELERDKNHDC